MKAKFDWVKDDPCYGCKYAVRLPEGQVNGIFGRRFGCTSNNRRNHLIGQAYKILETDWDMMSVRKAYDLLGVIVLADRKFLEEGHYPCHDGIVPWCKEVEDKKKD